MIIQSEMSDVDRWVLNVVCLLRYALEKRGARTKVCEGLGIHRNTLARACSLSDSGTQRDIGLIYSILAALDYDPVVVFSAAREAQNRTSMQ